MIDEIQAEAKPGGRIVIKINNLVDGAVIDALFEASSAGAEIDLIVRGICCLRPGVPGLSEHIRVRSILGRYLEHSRILRFGNGEAERRYYIGSADLMPRNLDRRVEALTPVEDPALRRRLDHILDLNLATDTVAWELRPDGGWVRRPDRRHGHAGGLPDTCPGSDRYRVREREVKLAVQGPFELPDLSAPGITADVREPQELRTTYHDTPDLRLARWGCSLRFRQGEGWTVKLPTTSDGALLVREELTFDGGPARSPTTRAASCWRISEATPSGRLPGCARSAGRSSSGTATAGSSPRWWTTRCPSSRTAA